ncbi:MAB_1171c family putative transporter [Streptomyces sp. LHD-70]|uniref:MAB_1171c family putative transporter n=1 Tax=Streptomyces sp. LHD-70 TaxID=3072140 RepID=UPI00280D760A|nr:MAB_1171c family putative transporter [Streptomyces sp. LHD-70]MDQ8703786.1 MAB_1171c family putative transporter [Streptomyces sp. LHD-70]
MSPGDYYIPAYVLGFALALKLPALIRNWRDPLLWSLCTLIFLAGLVFTFAAPPTIKVVNSASGVPNLAAPVTYSILSALSASCFVLLICWHSGDQATVRRVSGWCAGGFGAVSVALFVLFFLGHAPVERLQDFDTYYANSPYIREMILLYLVAHGAFCVGMSVLCLRWSRKATGWLRAGLLLLVYAFAITLGNAVCKLTAVVARWYGVDWDVLSTSIGPPLAAVGGTLCPAGFLLPMAGPQVVGKWRDWRAYRQLGPLLQELDSRSASGPHEVPLGPLTSLTLRVMQRETAIHDALLRLGPALDARIREQATEAARRDGHGERDAEVAGTAAMIAVAAQLERLAPDRQAAGRDDAARPGLPPGAVPAEEADLRRISQAMRHSAVVARFRREAAEAEGQHV